MVEYLASLDRIANLSVSRAGARSRRRHRRAEGRASRSTSRTATREKQILGVLKQGPARIPDIVETLYGGQELPEQLIDAAGWQVHAHLVKLKAAGKVSGASVKSVWKLALVASLGPQRVL